LEFGAKSLLFWIPQLLFYKHSTPKPRAESTGRSLGGFFLPQPRLLGPANPCWGRRILNPSDPPPARLSDQLFSPDIFSCNTDVLSEFFSSFKAPPTLPRLHLLTIKQCLYQAGDLEFCFFYLPFFRLPSLLLFPVSLQNNCQRPLTAVPRAPTSSGKFFQTQYLRRFNTADGFSLLFLSRSKPAAIRQLLLKVVIVALARQSLQCLFHSTPMGFYVVFPFKAF